MLAVALAALLLLPLQTQTPSPSPKPDVVEAMSFFGNPTGITPRAVIAEQGILFNGIAADFQICHGSGITSLTTTVNWHDGTPAEPLTPTDPLWQGHLQARHVFPITGPFPFSISMSARCYRDFGNGHTEWSESASATGGAQVYAPLPVASLIQSATTVAGGTPVDATVVLTAPAPPSGVTVSLTSNKPFASVQGIVWIPPNARRQVAPVLTTSPVPAGQTATISAVSIGPARTRNLRVN
jgi:hypothetical protein